jgi:hypothetical protein
MANVMKDLFTGTFGFVVISIIPEFNLFGLIQAAMQIAIAIITIYKLLKKPKNKNPLSL